MSAEELLCSLPPPASAQVASPRGTPLSLVSRRSFPDPFDPGPGQGYHVYPEKLRAAADTIAEAADLLQNFAIVDLANVALGPYDLGLPGTATNLMPGLNGRRTALHEGTVKRAEWIYDGKQDGQLDATIRHQDGKTYVNEVTGYDNHYQPTGTKVTIPAAGSPLVAE
ncbi:hypothetical protein LCL61_36995 [Amycolatopsis coloradensis]|uniref:Uncharacterized protein n=1 Tax=Amycolatopsis coloradensis TaxID=76021 RepID=A0ACD5BPD0_9PSEU